MRFHSRTAGVISRLCAAVLAVFLCLVASSAPAFPPRGAGARSVGVPPTPTLSFNVLPGGLVSSSVGISGAYTVAAPSGLTGATYGGGCSGSSTISGFTAAGGNWTATATTPSAACTGTLAVTGTGSNTASATSPSAGFSTGCPRGTTYVDGCPGAPAGPVQQPALLSSYSVRPPWNVAGVDFRTGYPIATTLADPATISVGGVTVNAGAHTVTITGNNVTLSGYDFGLANGWYVIVNGANDTVQNSHFKVGTNQGGIEGHVLDATNAASNFSFMSNEVDGNSIGQAVYDGLFYTVGFASTGTLTVKYNYFHHSGGDMIDYNDVNVTSTLFRYNYFQDIGLNTDHSDTVQWCGSIINSGDFAFNVVNQTQAGLSGEGLMTLNSECPGSNIRNTTVRNNTLISKVNDNFIVGQTITQDAGMALGDHNATYNNYTDPTGVYAFTGSPWFPMTGYNTSPNASLGTPAALHTLINMVNNTQIPVPTVSTPQGGYYAYPDLAGYSSSLSDIFSITASPASGNVTTGSTITFTLVMDAPTTVTATPTMTLNSGGTASYASGSGTKTLIFTYTVGGGQAATPLAVNSISGTMHDDVGNVTLLAPLTNLTATFAGLSVNSGAPSLAFSSLNGAAVSGTTTGSGTYTGSAPSNLTSLVYNAPCSGGSTVSGFSASGGSWNATFTTPSTACTGTLTAAGMGSNTGIATSPSASFTGGGGGGGGSCPDDDGSALASAGAPQFPTILSGYVTTINGPGGLGCKVVGVDFHVGLPSGTSLVVPTGGNVPAGVSVSGNTVSIDADNVTFQGFDMTGKSLQASGRSGFVVQNNKFQVTGTCLEPILFTSTGSGIVQYNDMDGAQNLCPTLAGSREAEVNFEGVSAGATVKYQFNYHINSRSDNIDLSGPGSGAGTLLDQYNLYYGAGYGSPGGSHPDGIQFCGGNFTGSAVRHNTFILPQSQLAVGADTQMFHVEAQCSPSGQIRNTLVVFNTTVQPGSAVCHAVDIPGTCTSNATIHCKNDSPGSTVNDGFHAYGNYMDWTTSQVGIDNSACTNSDFNTPYPNKDMKNGATMVVGAGHP